MSCSPARTTTPRWLHAAAWSVIAYAELGDGDKAAGLFSLLNPILHANTRSGVHRYKVEPYVMSADVYSVPPHSGRGGWTWYTGSASWAYRVALEAILGFSKRGNTLVIEPCIPPSWQEFRISYRFGGTLYEIMVINPEAVARGVSEVTVDGRSIAGPIPLVDDGRSHTVTVRLGTRTR